jgi:hypothetical protein
LIINLPKENPGVPNPKYSSFFCYYDHAKERIPVRCVMQHFVTYSISLR